MRISPINSIANYNNSKKVKQNKQVTFGNQPFELVKQASLYNVNPRAMLRNFDVLFNECKASSGFFISTSNFLKGRAFDHLGQMYERLGLHGMLAALGEAGSRELQLIREKGENDFEDVILAKSKDETKSLVLEDLGPYSLFNTLFNYSSSKREIALSFKNDNQFLRYSLDKKNNYKIKLSSGEIIINPHTFQVKKIDDGSRTDLYLPPGLY